jgi:hypothetical protein
MIYQHNNHKMEKILPTSSNLHALLNRDINILHPQNANSMRRLYLLL